MESFKARILRMHKESVARAGGDRQTEIDLINILIELVSEVHGIKSSTYGISWRRRGWSVSIFGNIARKFDRLENIFIDPNKVLKYVENPDVNSSEESVFDTLMDLGIYSLLAASEIIRKNPKMFIDWMEKTFPEQKPKT